MRSWYSVQVDILPPCIAGGSGHKMEEILAEALEGLRKKNKDCLHWTLNWTGTRYLQGS